MGLGWMVEGLDTRFVIYTRLGLLYCPVYTLV